MIERTVDDVAVPRDPADVGRRPADVGLGLYVKDVVVGGGRLGEVSPGRVEDALGLGGRARGVHDEHRVFGVEGLVGVGVALTVDEVVPPVVASLGPLDVATGAPNDEYRAHVRDSS